MATKVLIVDDARFVRQQVASVLVPAGFDVVEAVDGADALAVLRREAGIALVLCDVNMPNLGGLEFLEAVRRPDAWPKLRVVMLTTEGQAELIQRAKAAGALGWIVKPFKPESLVATVRRLTSMPQAA